MTVHGDLLQALGRREDLAAQAAALRANAQQPVRTVADLLARWLAAEHDWKPGIWRGYRGTVRRLSQDPLARRSPASVTPAVLAAAERAWTTAGVPATTISLNVRTLRSAFGWAHEQRLLAITRWAGMRGPDQPEPRRDVPLDVVRDLLRAADHDVDRARQPLDVHRVEQLRLLLRVAADTGARRGELDTLHLDDLHGRLLHIERGVSDEVVGTTKTGRSRRITVGTHTARLWQGVGSSGCPSVRSLDRGCSLPTQTTRGGSG